MSCSLGLGAMHFRKALSRLANEPGTLGDVWNQESMYLRVFRPWKFSQPQSFFPISILWTMGEKSCGEREGAKEPIQVNSSVFSVFQYTYCGFNSILWKNYFWKVNKISLKIMLRTALRTQKILTGFRSLWRSVSWNIVKANWILLSGSVGVVSGYTILILF